MKHILYTEYDGGPFRYYSKHTDEETIQEFKKIIEVRRLQYQTGDKIVRVVPVYVALVEDIDDYDFTTNKSRINKPADVHDLKKDSQ